MLRISSPARAGSGPTPSGLLEGARRRPGSRSSSSRASRTSRQLGPMELVAVSHGRGASWPAPLARAEPPRTRTVAGSRRRPDAGARAAARSVARSRPSIVVHDVGPLVAPAFYSLPKKLRYQAVPPSNVPACASAVVCVSDATLAGLSRPPVSTLGAVRSSARALSYSPGNAASGHDEPYFLYVGSLDRGRTWRRCRRLVGAEPPHHEAPHRRAHRPRCVACPGTRLSHDWLRRSRAPSRVRRPRAAGRPLPGAQAVVLPSLYEGFGLAGAGSHAIRDAGGRERHPPCEGGRR